MPPTPGTIHRAARRDSGAARMWAWAASRRKPWSTIDLGAAVGGSPRRIRAIVRAWCDGGAIVERRPAEKQPDGSQGAALYEVAAGRRAGPAPVLVVRDGIIAGIRQGTPAATARLVKAAGALGMSTRELARELGIDRRALGRMLAGDVPVADDDPVFGALARLAARARGA